MNLLPDLSLFAVSGFASWMSQRPSATSSLVLYSDSCADWDGAFDSDDPELYNLLHELTAERHSIYLSSALRHDFLQQHSDHQHSVIEPARRRILSKLEQYGVTDIDKYSKDADWLYLLFAGKHQHHEAAKLAAKVFNLNFDELPAIIIWRHIDDREVVILLPVQAINPSCNRFTSTARYIEELYRAIIRVTEEQGLDGNAASMKRLSDALSLTLRESLNCGDAHPILRGCFRRSFRRTVRESLSLIGQRYKNTFNDAVLAFEEAKLPVTSKATNFIKFLHDQTRKVKQQLQQAGFEFVRQGSEHEIWKHPRLAHSTPVPRHQFVTSFVLDKIRKDISAAIALS